MKLNKRQRLALAFWLGGKIPSMFRDHTVISDFDAFCDGEISEWRVMYNWGMAGKLWSSLDKLYVTGMSPHELDKKAYKRQQEVVERYNKELEVLMSENA